MTLCQVNNTTQHKTGMQPMTLNMLARNQPLGDTLIGELETLVSIAKCSDSLTNYVIYSLNSIEKTVQPKPCSCIPSSNYLPKEFFSAPPLLIKTPSKIDKEESYEQIFDTQMLRVQGTGMPEKKRIMRKLGGFEYRASHTWRILMQHFGSDVKRSTLCEVAKFISRAKGIKMDRDSKRRKDVLVKWFSDNWQMVFPLLTCIHIENDMPIFHPPFHPSLVMI